MNLTSKDINEMDVDMLKEALEELEKERPTLRIEGEKVINGTAIKEIKKRISELENTLPESEATIHKTAPVVMDHKAGSRGASRLVVGDEKSMISF